MPPTPFDLQQGFSLLDIEVEPKRQRIIRADEEIHVEPRVMAVLVTLAGHAGHPVSRETLLDAVWSDAVVGDEVLSRAISLLRSALGDERKEPKFIQTLPRKGYELIVTPTPISAPRKRRANLWAVSAGASVLLALAAWALWPSGKIPESVLVIMPIAPADTQLGGIAQGLTEDLYTLVNDSPRLSSLARRWSFGLRDTSLPPKSIAEEFGAQFLLAGNLQRSDTALQLELELVQLPTGKSVWMRQLDAQEDHALRTLTIDATREALNRWADAGLPAQKPPQPVTINEAAYRAYLAASHHWSLRGSAHIERAAALLRTSIQQDPDFYRGYLSLAQVYAMRPFYSDLPVDPQFGAAREMLARAVAGDPGLRPDAMALEGFMALRSRQWALAEARLTSTLAQAPDNALAQYWMGMLRAATNQMPAALRHSQRAAALAPTSAVIKDRLAISYLWANQTEQAGRTFAEARALGYSLNDHSKAFIIYLIRTRKLEDLRIALRQWHIPREWIDDLLPALQSDAVSPRVHPVHRAGYRGGTNSRAARIRRVGGAAATRSSHQRLRLQLQVRGHRTDLVKRRANAARLSAFPSHARAPGLDSKSGFSEKLTKNFNMLCRPKQA